MFKKEEISGRQLRSLIFIFISATATLYMPTFVTVHAEQDAWLSVLIGSSIGVIVALVTTELSYRFPELTFVEYVEHIIGKWPGKILAFLYIPFTIHVASIITSEVASTIQQILLPRTDMIIVAAVLFVAASYAVKCGLETFTRANVLNIITIYLSLFMVLFLLFKDLDPHQLTPILSKGITPILQDSVSPAGWFCEVVFVGFIAPFINKQSDLRKNAVIGVVWAGFTLAIIVTISLMTFGPKLTSILTYPTFQAVRYINVSDYILRIEVIFLIPWLISNFLKLSFFYYIAALMISRFFKLEHGESIVMPVGFVIFLLSFVLFESNIELVQFLTKVWGIYSLVPEFVIPSILLLITVIMKKGKRNEQKT